VHKKNCDPINPFVASPQRQKFSRSESALRIVACGFTTRAENDPRSASINGGIFISASSLARNAFVIGHDYARTIVFGARSLREARMKRQKINK